jgi:hypothetical protein
MFKVTRDGQKNNLNINSSLRTPRFDTTNSAISSSEGSLVYDRDQQTLCVSTGDSWKCLAGGDCIMAANSANGLVLTPPLFLDRHGIGRLIGNSEIEDLKPPESTFVLLPPESFVVDYESAGAGPNLLLQGNLFTVPDNYPNECLENWSVFVEVDYSLSFLGSEYVVITGISKNGSDITVDTPTTSMFTESSDIDLNTIHFHDIVRCFPGDTLDIGVYIEGGVVFFLNADPFVGDTVSHATFKIVGFENSIL